MAEGDEPKGRAKESTVDVLLDEVDSHTTTTPALPKAPPAPPRPPGPPPTRPSQRPPPPPKPPSSAGGVPAVPASPPARTPMAATVRGIPQVQLPRPPIPPTPGTPVGTALPPARTPIGLPAATPPGPPQVRTQVGMPAAPPPTASLPTAPLPPPPSATGPGTAPSPAAPPRKPGESTPPPADPLSEEALALVRACEAELATGPDAARAARLHYEVARLSESPLGDLRRAAAHYQEALTRVPDHLPSIRGARRVLIARKSYQQALALFDAEARITSDARRKAAIVFAKGRLLDDVMGLKAEAREAYQAALELHRSDPSLLKAIEQTDYAAEAWDALALTWERAANAVESDPRHRAALIVQRARLVEQRKGTADAAIELYETALRLDPDAPGALAALKRLHRRERRWRDLIGVLMREAESSEDPGVRAMALYRVGRLHAERLGNRGEALGALERAAFETPDDPLILEELARHDEAAERWDALADVLGRLVTIATELSDRLTRLHRLGQIHEEKLKDDDAAIGFHERALATDPTYVPSLQALAKLYARHGKHAELVRMHLAEAETAEEPHRRAAAHARVAEILESNLGRVEEAAEHHGRALALVPGYPTSFKALARIFGALGKHRELIDLYERAIDAAPDRERQITYLFKIGEVYEDALGDPGQAAHAYRRVLALESGSLAAIHALQRATERAGRYQELVEALELEAEKTRDDAHIVALLHRAGEVLDDKLGDRDGALARFKKVLAIDPKYVPALTSLGRVYYRAGRWEDLLAMYQRELEVTPRGPQAVALLLKMGELCEERIGRDDEALTCFRRAVDIEPTSGPALRALARKLRDRGEHAELAKVLELEIQGIGDAAHRALALYKLGEVYEEQLAMPDRAITTYELSLKARQDYRPSIDALARLRAEAKAWPKLVEDLEREAATTRDPHLLVAALLREGEVWATELKEPRRAIVCYEKVLEREPSNLGALLALESLYRRAGSFNDLARVLTTQAEVLTDPGARVAALRELTRVMESRAIGTPETLRATLDAILSLVPDDPGALAALERIGIEKTDRKLLARALASLAAATDDPTAVAAYQTRLGESLEALGDPSALAAYRLALAADAESLGATRGLSRLAEKMDDPVTLSEAARREAHVARSGDVAARLLVRSAQVRQSRLGDVAGAIQDLERALELHPDSIDAAAIVTETLLAQDDAPRVVDLLSRAASSAKQPERIAALWYEVARLDAEQLGNVAGAIGALNRVLRATPTHVPTLAKLAGLYARDGQWTEAANLYGRIVQLAPERDVLRDAHLELAAIWDERLGEPARALVSLGAVLALDATNKAALARLAALHGKDGDHAKAADVARRLLATATSPTERAAALLVVSRAEAALGHRDAAAEALHESVAIEGPGGPAAEAMKSDLEAHGGWESYATALVAHVQSGAAARTRRPALAYLELARVQDDEIGLRDDAIATLREGIAATGDDALLRDELARRLRRAGRGEEALRELSRLLAADAMRSETYREISRTYEAMKRPEESRLALAPLVVLGVAEPAELSILGSRPPRAGQARPGSFDVGALAAIDAGARHEHAAALVASLAEALPKLYPADLESFGLSPRDKVSTRTPTPLRDLTDRIAAIFGVPSYDLYVHRARGRGVAVELGDVPMVLVPQTLTEVSEAARVFAIARPFANIARGLAPLEKLTPREIEIVVASAVRSVVPGFGAGLTAEEYLEDHGRRISKTLSRKNRNAMQEIAQRYAAAPPPDYATWVRAVMQTANRAAVLVCDDLVTAVDVLRRTERDLSGLDGSTAARASPVIADLLRFWVSEASIAVRRRAGLIA